MQCRHCGALTEVSRAHLMFHDGGRSLFSLVEEAMGEQFAPFPFSLALHRGAAAGTVFGPSLHCFPTLLSAA